MTNSGSIIKPNWILVPIFAFIAFAKFNNVFSFYFNLPGNSNNMNKKIWDWTSGINGDISRDDGAK